MIRPTLFVCVLVAAASVTPLSADDPLDSEFNPASGSIESVLSKATGGVTDIRHSVDPGQGAPTVSFALTSNPAPDLAPRIAIEADGRAGVTWWRDGAVDTVHARTRDAATKTWTAETAVSDPTVDARNPEIVSDGTDLWVAFEADAGGGDTAVQVRGIRDDPDPIVMIAPYVSFGGDLDTLIHFAEGDLWVTWVDSGSEVGWSTHDAATDTWSVPAYESYANDSIEDARARVRSTVHGN